MCCFVLFSLLSASARQASLKSYIFGSDIHCPVEFGPFIRYVLMNGSLKNKFVRDFLINYLTIMKNIL